ncbi:hypothetical protein METBIDRAFT_35893 [Metschnikowia bicuspidata var. bicuspidata NRRL YB-4993]|uniref:SP-RING-type domain-containing protein n=1 Tax=Metschnikowia bicuspidata var. bicuspidata NRRL YB-4993 TaxID=869754 RepID=A0A1A0HIB4_9ASCO|nr:hypothetical protein METBIDRAFT_35893 [Metschnikowia bicuspidata var. bicuspidata NRRL YB-4993]OBA23741.1 hypothetical protein METBIDRAFT_35893 [Metschnikowia bicuspidata var. bicuspidata NRRL YB-4993]
MSESPEPNAVAPLPDFNTDLPSYYPVHLSLKMTTDFAPHLYVKQIDEQLVTVRNSVDRFLKYMTSNVHLFQDENATKFLGAQRQNYADLLMLKHKLLNYQDSFKSTQRNIIESRRNEPDLSLENLDFYRNMDKENFADSVALTLDNTLGSDDAFTQTLHADSVYQFLKNALFVIENPEYPLPDESTDEELAVSGGKVSLKDPLSMDYFSEPVISLRCQHVFESKYIRQQLEHNSKIKCPITGCQADLTARDLKDDRLMALRIKVFQARAKKREQRVRI